MTLYRTIVADPLWRVGAGPSGGGYHTGPDGKQLSWVRPASTASPPLPFPSMSVTEIMALRPAAAPDAHLYLWTINAYLRDAFDIAEAWGFKPSTTLVWAKRPMGGGLG